MRMVQVADGDAERVYVDSLRWRREDLQGKLEAVGLEIASLTRDEAELRQQLRAVEQLLTASGASLTDGKGSIHMVDGRGDVAASASRGTDDADRGSLDFSAFGPKSRGIYSAAAQVIGEAGVPLHYRVLAEEVQKRVPLSGVDPGATLIAHLQRAKDFFPRVGRGVYGLQGMANAGTDATLPQTTAGRRRKTRRRTR